MMIFDEYSFPDDATIANADQYKVYYKPEDGVCGINDYVGPGEYIKDPIDGIATSKYFDQVFKIPDGGRVIVRLGGNVEFTNGGIYYDALELLGIRCGWKDALYFQDQKAYQDWESLFRLARLWIK
jgi:hypothetical protein